jgi:hypothetical protein
MPIKTDNITGRPEHEATERPWYSGVSISNKQNEARTFN